MQRNPHELTQKFLKACDGDFNVVDMPAMLEIMSVLEECTSTLITREVLEETRIGRHVNYMRRKTTNEALAKRAKNLVKRWQALLGAATPPPAPLHHAATEGRINGQHLPKTKSVPEKLDKNRTVITSGHTRKSPELLTTYEASNNGGSGEPANITASGRKRRLKGDNMDGPHAKVALLGGSSSPLITHKKNGQMFTPSHASLRVKPSSPAIVTPTLRRTNSVASIGSGHMELKTSKVRSTAEILKNVISSTGINMSESETAKKVALNQIVKEKDEEVSIVPEGAKPRRRKKPVGLPPAASDAVLSKNKHDMVRKFLDSSVEVPVHVGDVDIPSPRMHMTDSLPGSLSRCDSERSLKEDANSRLLDLIQSQQTPGSSGTLRVKFTLGPSPSAEPAVKVAKIASEVTQGAPSLEELWARLPPLNDIPDEPCDDTVPAPASPTPENLDRLKNSEWANVNGTYNCDGWWRSWSQNTTMHSYRNEPLHILPYVNIDEENLFVDM